MDIIEPQGTLYQTAEAYLDTIVDAESLLHKNVFRRLHVFPSPSRLDRFLGRHHVALSVKDILTKRQLQDGEAMVSTTHTSGTHGDVAYDEMQTYVIHHNRGIAVEFPWGIEREHNLFSRFASSLNSAPQKDFIGEILKDKIKHRPWNSIEEGLAYLMDGNGLQRLLTFEKSYDAVARELQSIHPATKPHSIGNGRNNMYTYMHENGIEVFFPTTRSFYSENDYHIAATGWIVSHPRNIIAEYEFDIRHPQTL